VIPGLVIEPLATADRAVLRFVFAHLGPASRYGRFHAIKPELHREDLDLLTDVDHWHAEALVAWSPVPRAPIGVARYVRGEDFDLAEVAFAVADAWQGRGVGSALGLALRERALRAGIRRFSAIVLGENRAGLALARRLGANSVATAAGVVEMRGRWDC
jgi:acetyltransferase